MIFLIKIIIRQCPAIKTAIECNFLVFLSYTKVVYKYSIHINAKIMKFTTRAAATRETRLSYLGGINISAKLVHSKEVSKMYTYIIYLAPANTSGYNVCSHSTPECRLGCLSTSGRNKLELWAGMNRIQNARTVKTKLFFEEQDFFMQWMIEEIKSSKKKAEREGFYFSVRLNGTSDIVWENVKYNGLTIFEIFSDVQFYDYTKNASRLIKKLPENYHITLSHTGKNTEICKSHLACGGNVAVVFTGGLPETWNGYKVIDGDLTDYRPNDGYGVVVGLKFKEIANRENSEIIKNSCFVEKVNVQTIA